MDKVKINDNFELLLKCMHEMQSLCESYYLEEKEKYDNVGCVKLDDSLFYKYPQEIAKRMRLESKLECLEFVSLWTKRNSICGQFERLISSSNSFSDIMKVPYKLAVYNYKARKSNINRSLKKHVNDLLKIIESNNNITINDIPLRLIGYQRIAADLLTNEARRLEKIDPVKCANLAALAYQVNPNPFRLKWYAFRLSKTENIVNSEFFLNMILDKVNWSQSEKNRFEEIKYESSYYIQVKSMEESKVIKTIREDVIIRNAK